MSEYHSGYRAYSVKALKKIPYNLNSNYFHFDTQILLQLKVAMKKYSKFQYQHFMANKFHHLSQSSMVSILKTTNNFLFTKIWDLS